MKFSRSNIIEEVVARCRRPARISLQNRKTVFGILLRTAGEILRNISADPWHFGARVGGTAVVDTWNMKMEWHRHLNGLVPDGGFDKTTTSPACAPPI